MMILRLAAAMALVLSATACSLIGTSSLDLAVGDCFNTDAQDQVGSVDKKNCDELHTYEIYAAFDHPGGSDAAFPGSSEISTFADDGCTERFEAFVGKSYEESELYIYYLSPSEDTWGNGDREVLCSVYLQDEQLQGSMEDSGR